MAKHKYGDPANYADSNRLMPPPDNPWEVMAQERAVSSIVWDFAARERPGSPPDLSGLVLKEREEMPEGADEYFVHYVINQRPVAEEEIQWRHQGPRRWDKPRQEGVTRILHEFGRPDLDPVPLPYTEQAFDIDIYENYEAEDPNGRRLISKLTFGSLKEFNAYLDSHGDSPEMKAQKKRAGRLGYYKPAYLVRQAGNTPVSLGQLEPVGWDDTIRPTPPAELPPTERRTAEIPVRRHEDGVFEDIFRSREQLDVPGESWFGLTLDVSQDIGNDPKTGLPKPRPIRKLQVTQDSLVYTPDESGGWQITRTWEVSEYAQGGHMQFQPKKRIFRDDELRDFINRGYKDRTIRRAYWELSSDAFVDTRFASTGRSALAASGLEYGAGTPDELSSLLTDGYTHTADKLDILTDDESRNRALESLHHLAASPGMLGFSRAARNRRRLAIDYEVGLSFLDLVVAPALGAEQVPHIENGFVEIKPKAILTVSLNSRLMDRLQEFIKPGQQGLEKILGNTEEGSSDSLVATLRSKLQAAFSATSGDVPERFSKMPGLLESLGSDRETKAQITRLGRLLRRQVLQ